MLSLPHACYELAELDGQPGVVTKNFVPDGSTLIHGNEILSGLDPNYPNPDISNRRFTRVPQHTIDRLVRANNLVDLVRPPLNWPMPFDVKSAAEVLVGYLLLDAWIGNTDRHHENWGWVGARDDKRRPDYFCLAPTFDHASSLGRNESDQKRRQRLVSRDRGFNLEAYVEKCLSAFYAKDDAPSPLTTHKAFIEIGRRMKVAGNVWLMSLERIRDEDVERIFRRIPRSRISNVAIEFALGVLKVNRARLLKWSHKL